MNRKGVYVRVAGCRTLVLAVIGNVGYETFGWVATVRPMVVVLCERKCERLSGNKRAGA